MHTLKVKKIYNKTERKEETLRHTLTCNRNKLQTKGDPTFLNIIPLHVRKSMSKTLVVSTLALSNDTTVEEGGAAKGADIASVVEEGGP